MKKKEDLRVIKTKNNLYEGLLNALKDKPFEEVKVSDICQLSLVNRSTFYDHFNDKYELLSAFLCDLEEGLANRLEENHNVNTAKEYYMQMIELLFDHIMENASIYRSIIKNNNHSIASDMFEDTLLKDVKKYMETMQNYQGDIPVEIVSTFYVNAVISVCLHYLRNPKKYNKEDILLYLNKLLPDQLY